MEFEGSPGTATVPSDQLLGLGQGRLKGAVEDLARFSPKFNWVGVYILQGQELKLGPFVGEPTEHTTIPVGQGVCGTAVLENRDQNIPDVRMIGNYIACNLRTRSELVVLIKDSSGKILGQIDIDSDLQNAFGPLEVAEVQRVARELSTLWNA